LRFVDVDGLGSPQDVSDDGCPLAAELALVEVSREQPFLVAARIVDATLEKGLMPAVVFDHVSKRFTLQRERDRSFQELAVNILRRLRGAREKEDFWALRDVCLTVEPGETLGIIGENGSGKSTTLKLISRILEPTEGWIEVNGRVSALLELGAGFHPDLTGRENIYLNASILGFRRREIHEKIQAIIDAERCRRDRYEAGFVAGLTRPQSK